MTADVFKSAQSSLMNTKDGAPADFRWPPAGKFNWATDWFDAELAQGPNRDRVALKTLGDGAEAISFAEMAARSSCVANGLRARGVRRRDRIMLMLGNTAPLWETMLAAMKLGAVVIPSTLMLTAKDINERIRRARIQHVIVSAAETTKFEDVASEVQRICTGTAPAGWLPFDELRDASHVFKPEQETDADDPMLLYFTSGTTSRPKWCSTAIAAIRWDIWRRCIGSARGPAIRILRWLRRAGPVTRSWHSSDRGTQALPSPC